MKWIFPLVWFGILLTVFVGAQFSAEARRPALWIPFGIMLVFGSMLFRMLLWNLADEVQGCGGYLMIRRGNAQERVELSNIINVSTSQFTSPRRLTLRLRMPGAFGDEVVFVPKSFFQLNPFARNPVVEDLIRRVDRARNGVVPA